MMFGIPWVKVENIEMDMDYVVNEIILKNKMHFNNNQQSTCNGL